MDLLAAFGIFLACVVCCMVGNISLFWAMLAGFVCFFAVGLRRGFGAGALLRMAAGGMGTSWKVLRILALLGLLTALWRAGGTVAIFVWGGVRLITPRTFILIAFLLSSVFCMAFGSCFGVAGTAGVILMAIARTSGANLTVTAGAILSGIYVGERLSPASSSAALTAAVSGVDQGAFLRQMWRTSPAPLALSTAIYAGLSWLYPVQQMDVRILSALEEGFVLSWPALLPAAALLILPWLKLSAVRSILVSCVLAFLSALLVQGVPVGELLRACLLGYRTAQPELADILSGGGLLSMVNGMLIVVLSCAYSGMFSGTGLLRPVTGRLNRLADRAGLALTHIVLSLGCTGLFCNQTVSIVMSAQLMKEAYRGREPMELAVNIGNTAINLAGLVPWAIAATVPLAALEVGPSALPWAAYLYLLPLCHWISSCRSAAKKKPAGGKSTNL